MILYFLYFYFLSSSKDLACPDTSPYPIADHNYEETSSEMSYKTEKNAEFDKNIADIQEQQHEFVSKVDESNDESHKETVSSYNPLLSSARRHINCKELVKKHKNQDKVVQVKSQNIGVYIENLNIIGGADHNEIKTLEFKSDNLNIDDRKNTNNRYFDKRKKYDCDFGLDSREKKSRIKRDALICSFNHQTSCNNDGFKEKEYVQTKNKLYMIIEEGNNEGSSNFINLQDKIGIEYRDSIQEACKMFVTTEITHILEKLELTRFEEKHAQNEKYYMIQTNFLNRQLNLIKEHRKNENKMDCLNVNVGQKSDDELIELINEQDKKFDELNEIFEGKLKDLNNSILSLKNEKDEVIGDINDRFDQEKEKLIEILNCLKEEKMLYLLCLENNEFFTEENDNFERSEIFYDKKSDVKFEKPAFNINETDNDNDYNSANALKIIIFDNFKKEESFTSSSNILDFFLSTKHKSCECQNEKIKNSDISINIVNKDCLAVNQIEEKDIDLIHAEKSETGHKNNKSEVNEKFINEEIKQSMVNNEGFHIKECESKICEELLLHNDYVQKDHDEIDKKNVEGNYEFCQEALKTEDSNIQKREVNQDIDNENATTNVETMISDKSDTHVIGKIKNAFKVKDADKIIKENQMDVKDNEDKLQIKENIEERKKVVDDEGFKNVNDIVQKIEHDSGCIIKCGKPKNEIKENSKDFDLAKDEIKKKNQSSGQNNKTITDIKTINENFSKMTDLKFQNKDKIFVEENKNNLIKEMPKYIEYIQENVVENNNYAKKIEESKINIEIFENNIIIENSDNKNNEDSKEYMQETHDKVVNVVEENNIVEKFEYTIDKVVKMVEENNTLEKFKGAKEYTKEKEEPNVEKKEDIKKNKKENKDKIIEVVQITNIIEKIEKTKEDMQEIKDNIIDGEEKDNVVKKIEYAKDDIQEIKDDSRLFFKNDKTNDDEVSQQSITVQQKQTKNLDAKSSHECKDDIRSPKKITENLVREDIVKEKVNESKNQANQNAPNSEISDKSIVTNPEIVKSISNDRKSNSEYSAQLLRIKEDLTKSQEMDVKKANDKIESMQEPNELQNMENLQVNEDKSPKTDSGIGNEDSLKSSLSTRNNERYCKKCKLHQLD